MAPFGHSENLGADRPEQKKIKMTMPPFVEVNFLALEQFFHLTTRYESSRAKAAVSSDM